MPASGGPRKPLHLDGREQPIEVRAAGPTLAVAVGARRMQFPLARLSRILVRGRVRWDSDALSLCLGQQIPVVFLDSRARPIGAALALLAQPSTVGELLADFVERPDWRACYENWLRNERFRVLFRWRRERAAVGAPLAGAEWREAVRAHVYVPDFYAPGSAAGECYALALEMLSRAGVHAQYRSFDGTVLPLAADLGRLLDLRVSLQVGTLGRHFDRHDQLTARAFQEHAEEHEAFLVMLLGRLRARLGNLVEPWP